MGAILALVEPLAQLRTLLFFFNMTQQENAVRRFLVVSCCVIARPLYLALAERKNILGFLIQLLTYYRSFLEYVSQ